MTDEPDFRAMFSEEDAAEIAKAFADVDAEDPGATSARNVLDITTSPLLSWRTALSAACTEEGVAYQWNFADHTSFFFALGAHPVIVPDDYLEALRVQGSHPHAVACLMKAVSIDPRFRGWREDEPEDEDLCFSE